MGEVLSTVSRVWTPLPYARRSLISLYLLVRSVMDEATAWKAAFSALCAAPLRWFGCNLAGWILEGTMLIDALNSAIWQPLPVKPPNCSHAQACLHPLLKCNNGAGINNDNRSLPSAGLCFWANYWLEKELKKTRQNPQTLGRLVECTVIIRLWQYRALRISSPFKHF